MIKKNLFYIFPALFLILLFSINIVADQKISINGYNLEVKEKVIGNITEISYFLTDKDRKKICGSSRCGNKFDKIVNASKSEILRSTCKSRDLYKLYDYIKNNSYDEKVGRVYRCTDSLKYLLERTIPKIDIKKEIEKTYDVTVESVRTMICIGKERIRGTKSGFISGRTKTVKKAIVQLSEGDSIDFYSNI